VSWGGLGNEQGHGAGDQFVFKGDLTDDGGVSAGHSLGQCVMVADDAVQCTATLALEHGNIAVSGGAIEDGSAGGFTVAIVGGTGDYRGASGEIEVKDVDETTSELTVHLD
jgi:allene oxide cyclase-like protein